MVFTNRDENVLVDVEWSGEALRKDVHDVVIAICPVIEFNAKCILPLLRLQNMSCIRCVKDEAFKIEFAHTGQFRSRLKVHIGVVTDAVTAFEKADLRIEVGADLAMLTQDFEPAVLVINSGSDICLSG